jgi:hypothetical protein
VPTTKALICLFGATDTKSRPEAVIGFAVGLVVTLVLHPCASPKFCHLISRSIPCRTPTQFGADSPFKRNQPVRTTIENSNVPVVEIRFGPTVAAATMTRTVQSLKKDGCRVVVLVDDEDGYKRLPNRAVYAADVVLNDGVNVAIKSRW